MFNDGAGPLLDEVFFCLPIWGSGRTYTPLEAYFWLVSRKEPGIPSIGDMSKVWKWHKSKVHRFMETLRKQHLYPVKVPLGSVNGTLSKENLEDASSSTGKAKKQTQRKEPNTLWHNMIKEYKAFLDKDGLPLSIRGAESKGLKSIMTKITNIKESELKQLCKSNNKDFSQLDPTKKQNWLESQILAYWQYILGHWGELSDYLQDKKRLAMIDYHMVDIISTLKRNQNGKGTTSKKHTQAITSAGSTDFSHLVNK